MPQHTALSDEELFRLLQSPEKREAAFRELYARHSKRVHAYCVRAISTSEQEAEDIFQETFVRFHHAAQTERTMTNVPAYLLRIARNLCLNHKRDNRPTLLLRDDDLPNTPREYGMSRPKKG